MEKVDRISRSIIHNSFNNTIEELQEVNIKLPNDPDPVMFDFANNIYPESGELVTKINELSAIDLNPKDPEIKNWLEKSIAAYDESINKFAALEGTAYLMSHSLIQLGKTDFLPLYILAFYFYTHSKDSNKWYWNCFDNLMVFNPRSFSGYSWVNGCKQKVTIYYFKKNWFIPMIDDGNINQKWNGLKYPNITEIEAIKEFYSNEKFKKIVNLLNTISTNSL